MTELRALTTSDSLVERLWPRGIRKSALPLNGWLKDVAPSTELRKWFGQDPATWKQFQDRHLAELRTSPQAWEPLLQEARKGTISLVYSSHDVEHNGALVLKKLLGTKLSHLAKAA
jgi:uncharacterized protein YeaO (DUF488 family)